MSRLRGSITTLATLLVVLTGACTSSPEKLAKLQELPDVDKYCQSAQRVVGRTEMRMDLVVHDSLDAFIKSKAIMDGPNGPQIQQYNWHDSSGRLTGISCKLKSAEHLNIEFGPGTAGPEGSCQDLNREVFRLVSAWLRKPAYTQVSFDPAENAINEDQPGMTGPDWLAPYAITYVDKSGGLHIAAKSFVVEFTDPRYLKAPERFRGVHYCHFVAPEYLSALLKGEAEPGAIIGVEVDRSGPPPNADHGG